MSTFYTEGDGAGLAAAVRTFFSTCKDAIKSGVTWSFPSGDVILDSSTGAVTGVWTGGALANVTSNGNAAFASGVGMRVVWETAGHTNNRRVRGSTYLVPLDINGYQTDGSITDATVTTVTTAANGLRTVVGSTPCIWHRPVDGANGVSHPVTAVTVPDKVTWLRSRRT